jgi:1-phosphofructokinase family hexose kinase
MIQSGYFLVVCLNPTIQKTLLLDNLVPDRVNRSVDYRIDAAGKGIDVSRVLVQLGDKALHLTQAGGWNKVVFLNLAENDGIDLHTVESDSDIRFCYTLLDRAHGTVTEIVEESREVSAKTEAFVLEKFRALLPGCHTLVISGSKAAGFSDSIFPTMTAEAHACGKVIILDIRGKDLLDALVSKPDYIKPNRDELIATFFGESGASDAQIDDMIESKLKEIYEQFGTKSIITNGKEPCVYFDGSVFRKALPVPVIPVNTTGCGDAFCAGFAHSIAGEDSMDKAVACGLECAGLNALSMRPGVIR